VHLNSKLKQFPHPFNVLWESESRLLTRVLAELALSW
jgi:hypothetical protein